MSVFFCWLLGEIEEEGGEELHVFQAITYKKNENPPVGDKPKQNYIILLHITI